MDHKHYMQEAVTAALKGMQNNEGGPFGCVIVKDGKIIGKGNNKVTSTNDPTAHAEVTAIRDACKNLGSFQLEGCTIYTSCEPCPMCLSAITWAGFNTIYYFFNYQDTKKAFNIAHDLDILSEVFGRSDGAYSKENYFWKCYAIKELINLIEPASRDNLLKISERISSIYASLSEEYQNKKNDNSIPLS